MNITRRAALLGGLSLPIVAMATRNGMAAGIPAETLPNPLLVAVTGSTPDSAPRRLAALLGPLLERSIAVTLSIAPTSESGSRLEPQSNLAQLLRTTVDGYPNLLELAIDAETIQSEDSYFQLRQASTAQAAFSWALNAGADHSQQPLLTALTVTTSTPLRSAEDLAGMRAAGIRTAIRVPGGERSGSTNRVPNSGYFMTSTGLANTIGDRATTTLSEAAAGQPRPPSAIKKGIRIAAVKDDPIIVHIPLSSVDSLSDTDLLAYATELGKMIAAARDQGIVRSILPYNLYTQTRKGAARYVIVRVDDYRMSPARDVTHTAFTGELLRAGIPFTEAVIPGGEIPLRTDTKSKAHIDGLLGNTNYDIATHGLNHTTNECLGLTSDEDRNILARATSEMYQATGKLPMTFVPPNNAFDVATLLALEACGVPMLSADKHDYRWIWGMGRRGILQLSNTISFEKSWEGDIPFFETEQVLKFFGSRNDAVFMIHPATSNAPEKKRQVMDVLAALSALPGTQLTNFESYYKAVTPEMPALELVRSARARAAVTDAGAATVITDMERKLKQDAAVAWQYFERGTAKFNGMVPATAWEENGKLQGYAFATMWDIGSFIMANVSAHRIGLIDQTGFETSIKRIIDFLGRSSYRYKGANLPETERPIGRERGQRKGFDSADVGRLLITLKILDQYTEQSFPVAGLVASWGLQASIIDGEMHDIGDGTTTSVQQNSYAHYPARGFRLWDIDVNPVYQELDPLADTDATLRFLEEVRSRGRIATEPSTTEEVELGASAYGKIIADVLHAAQVKRYEETGIPTCVSECPIDQSPWFTYQGYQIGRNGGTWVVDAPSANGRRQINRLGDKIRLVSTKGCFLWLATRPGAYSEMLHALVRKKGQTDGFGFASGVYEKRQRPTAHSDVNTNGIILEAIAYILNGRSPFLTSHRQNWTING